MRELVAWLLTREPGPELILHSPYVRARQTAETIAQVVGAGVVILEEPLLAPGVQTASLLRRVADSGMQRVACVGHQPDMSRCLAEMLGGGRVHFSPGTIAGIEFSEAVAIGAGDLRWLAPSSWFSG